MTKTTKEKLLCSALKLFNEKWFENTSTTSICSDAGFSSGALFVHFKTKNELLDYLYVDIKKNYFNDVFINLDNYSKPENKMKSIMEKSFNYYLNNYEAYAFMKNFANSVHISRIAKEKIELELKEFYKIHEEGRKKGIFINEDFEFVWAAIGGIFYSLVEYLKNNKDASIKKCVNIIMKIILK